MSSRSTAATSCYLALLLCNALCMQCIATSELHNTSVGLTVTIGNHLIDPQEKLFASEPFELDIHLHAPPGNHVNKLLVQLQSGSQHSMNVSESDHVRRTFRALANFNKDGPLTFLVLAVANETVVARLQESIHVFPSRSRFVLQSRMLSEDSNTTSLFLPHGSNIESLPMNSLVGMEVRVIDRWHKLDSKSLTSEFTRQGTQPYVEPLCTGPYCDIILKDHNFDEQVTSSFNTTAGYHGSNSTKVSKYSHVQAGLCETLTCWKFGLLTGNMPGIVLLRLSLAYVTFGTHMDVELSTTQSFTITEFLGKDVAKSEHSNPAIARSIQGWTNEPPLLRQHNCLPNYVVLLYRQQHLIQITQDSFHSTTTFDLKNPRDVVWKDTEDGICTFFGTISDCNLFHVHDVGIASHNMFITTSIGVITLTATAPSASLDRVHLVADRVASGVPPTAVYHVKTGQECTGLNPGFQVSNQPIGDMLHMFQGVPSSNTFSLTVSMWAMDSSPRVALHKGNSKLVPPVLGTVLVCDPADGAIEHYPSIVYDQTTMKWVALLPCAIRAKILTLDATRPNLEWVLGFTFPDFETLSKLEYHKSGLALFALGSKTWISFDSGAHFNTVLEHTDGQHVIQVASSGMGPEFAVLLKSGTVYVGAIGVDTILRVASTEPFNNEGLVQYEHSNFALLLFDWQGRLELGFGNALESSISISVYPVDSVIAAVHQPLLSSNTVLVPSNFFGKVTFKVLNEDRTDLMPSNRSNTTAGFPDMLIHFANRVDRRVTGVYNTYASKSSNETLQSASFTENVALPTCSSTTARVCECTKHALVLSLHENSVYRFVMAQLTSRHGNEVGVGWSDNNIGMSVLFPIMFLQVAGISINQPGVGLIRQILNSTHALLEPIMFDQQQLESTLGWGDSLNYTGVILEPDYWALTNFKAVNDEVWQGNTIRVATLNHTHSLLCIDESSTIVEFQSKFDLNRVVKVESYWGEIVDVVNSTCVSLGKLYKLPGSNDSIALPAFMSDATLMFRDIAEHEQYYLDELKQSEVQYAPMPTSRTVVWLTVQPCPYLHFFTVPKLASPIISRVDRPSSITVSAMVELPDNTCLSCGYHDPGVFRRSPFGSEVRIESVHSTSFAKQVFKNTPDQATRPSKTFQSLFPDWSSERLIRYKGVLNIVQVSVTGSNEPGPASFLVSPPENSLACPTGQRGSVYRAYFGCPNKRLWLDPKSIDRVSEAQQWVELPVNYRPPSWRGNSVPLTPHVYNADPSQEMYHVGLNVSRTSFQFKQCAGARSKAECNCTIDQLSSQQVNDTDCITRAMDVSYRNALVPELYVVPEEVLDPSHPSARKEKVWATLHLRELNGRFDYCKNSTSFERSDCGEADKVVGMDLNPRNYDGIVFVGQGLYHFEITVADSNSYCSLGTEFVVYVTQSPLTRVMEAMSISISGVVLAIVLLMMYWKTRLGKDGITAW